MSFSGGYSQGANIGINRKNLSADAERLAEQKRQYDTNALMNAAQISEQSRFNNAQLAEKQRQFDISAERDRSNAYYQAMGNINATRASGDSARAQKQSVANQMSNQNSQIRDAERKAEVAAFGNRPGAQGSPADITPMQDQIIAQQMGIADRAEMTGNYQAASDLDMKKKLLADAQQREQEDREFTMNQYNEQAPARELQQQIVQQGFDKINEQKDFKNVVGAAQGGDADTVANFLYSRVPSIQGIEFQGNNVVIDDAQDGKQSMPKQEFMTFLKVFNPDFMNPISEKNKKNSGELTQKDIVNIKKDLVKQYNEQLNPQVSREDFVNQNLNAIIGEQSQGVGIQRQAQGVPVQDNTAAYTEGQSIVSDRPRSTMSAGGSMDEMYASAGIKNPEGQQKDKSKSKQHYKHLPKKIAIGNFDTAAEAYAYEVAKEDYPIEEIDKIAKLIEKTDPEDAKEFLNRTYEYIEFFESKKNEKKLKNQNPTIDWTENDEYKYVQGTYPKRKTTSLAAHRG